LVLGVQQEDDVRERTDSELVAAVRAGDRAAFGVLLDRHERAVRTVVRRLLGENEADDIAQETFLQAYLGLDRLRDPARFGAWLCAIAVNLAKMRLRERRLLVPLEDYPDRDGGREAADLAELVASALETLPRHEREAVLLSYAGLSSPEVAALVGERPGTVRVRLHRARGRLRARLGTLIPQAGKETKMVEVVVHDVVARTTPMENGGEPQIVGDTRIVLLREKDGERVLPIWIGRPEGDALALELGGEGTPRPMTADLMAKLLEAAGARVESVAVNSLREETFYATILLVTGSGSGKQEVDARPSDALNLAARVKAPILVDDAVMEHAFTGDLEEKVREEQARRGVEEPEGEWRSLSPEMVKALYPAFPKRK
jgi:RNA polymerase sigma factor (sigma-70 family)